MIPLRLALHNFMCYREDVPPLELAHIRMACLSGDNGAGKSALLDAITWALWGKARVNSDLDLMSLGATEMRVEFEFRLGEHDYRVIRRRTRKGAAAGWLDLYLHDSESGVWKSLSGDGVRETQRSIVELLRMEYETFINSAFLLQGRADEFTTKRPAERKEVLGEILGLSIYDELEDKAKKLFRERAAQVKECDDECDRLRGVAEQEPAHQANLERLSTTLMSYDDEIERLTHDYQAVHAAVAALEREEQRLQQLQAQIGEAQRQQRQAEAWAEQCRQEIAGHERLLARREEIEAGADRLLAARQRRTELDGALRTLRAYEAQKSQLERTIEGERRRLGAEQQHQVQVLTKLERTVQTLPALEANHAEVKQSAGEATALAETIAARQAAERQAHGEIEALKARNAGLREEMKKLKQRQEQIDGADAGCPLCRRPLGAQEKAHIHEDYQAEGLRLKDQFRANEQQITALQHQGEQFQAEIRSLDLKLKEAQLAARREAQMRQQIEQARQAQIEQAAVQVTLVAVTERLERRDYALEERAALLELEAQIVALGYDEAAHVAAQEEERALEPYAQERVAVRQAAESLPRAREQLAAYEQNVIDLTGRIAQANAEVQALQQQLVELPDLRQQELDLKVCLQAKGRERDRVQLEMGQAAEQLRVSQRAAADLVTREADRARLAEEAELYKTLVEAFGKKGIQAMIIEQVVPEIQDEANRLLDQMPGNTMRVEFQTQRGNKAGDTIETLDVIIKDEVGARKYELYSGGEAFRANFAIRVALSKLLARRAGAQLQMLVIDEGFGTQDARGREGLVQAIQSVEQEFATILVITHLTDIKDEFPTRIDVVKSVDGSMVMLN